MKPCIIDLTRKNRGPFSDHEAKTYFISDQNKKYTRYIFTKRNKIHFKAAYLSMDIHEKSKFFSFFDRG